MEKGVFRRAGDRDESGRVRANQQEEIGCAHESGEDYPSRGSSGLARSSVGKHSSLVIRDSPKRHAKV